VDQTCAVARQRILRSVERSDEAIKAQHGAHHRYDDQRLVCGYFLYVENQFKNQSVEEFRFDMEVERIEREMIEKSGVHHIPEFRGPIVRIPERFSRIF